MLELPKRKGAKIPTKEDKIRQILKEDLIKTNSKEFVRDFYEALVEIEDITDINNFEIIKSKAETSNLNTLENTIKRYFKKNTKANFEVDFDLTKNKVITNEQYNKFFKISNEWK